MPQVARPDIDISAGAWTPFPVSPTTLWDKLDETTFSDADYVESEAAPATSACEVGLSSVTDPVSSVDHIINYRISKDLAGGAQIDAILRLREGVTTRASQTTVDQDENWTAKSYTLSGPEADTITDYGNLSLQMEANQP